MLTCVYVSTLPSCATEITDGSQYFVLLMITDGVISDMVQTKEAVVNVSKQGYCYCYLLLVFGGICDGSTVWFITASTSSVSRNSEETQLTNK